jgi:hypothetical protein
MKAYRCAMNRPAVFIYGREAQAIFDQRHDEEMSELIVSGQYRFARLAQSAFVQFSARA